MKSGRLEHISKSTTPKLHTRFDCAMSGGTEEEAAAAAAAAATTTTTCVASPIGRVTNEEPLGELGGLYADENLAPACSAPTAPRRPNQ